MRRSSAKARRPGRPRVLVEHLEDRRLLTGDATAALLHSYGNIPLSFQKNAGQASGEVQFLAQGTGYSLALSPGGATISLAGAPDDGLVHDIKISLLGTDPARGASGVGPSSGVSNYLIGNDPSAWHTRVANYSRVEYRGVYPGIDQVYYGTQNQVEYDFIVAPGASPDAIRMKVDGVDSMTLDGQGNLILHTAAGDLVEHAPVVYQEMAGTRVPVAGHYVLLADDVIGFAIGDYDAAQPLVIDPIIVYSSYLGGRNSPVSSIAVDDYGYVYVAGFTESFPWGIFVHKLDPSGARFVYSTFLGGSREDSAHGLAIDAEGNAYVTGGTASLDFPTTAGAFQGNGTESVSDCFVTKINPTGDGLVYSTYIHGADGQDYGTDIEVDPEGNAYVTGSTAASDFPTTPGAYQLTNNGATNGFITKLNPTGTGLVYSTYLGGSGFDSVGDMALDSVGSVYLIGLTFSTDFPVTPGALQPAAEPERYNSYVTKLNPAGTALDYSTYLGNVLLVDIALDPYGNALVVGDAFAGYETTPGSFQPTNQDETNGSIAKINPSGTALVYSTFLGGSCEDRAASVVVGPDGEIYVTGITASADFPTTPGIPPGGSRTSTDIFLVKFGPDFDRLIYTSFLGGSDNEFVTAIAVDPSGDIYLGGSTVSPDFPTTPGAAQPGRRPDGNRVGFVVKFAEEKLPISLQIAASPPSSSAFGETVTFSLSLPLEPGGVPPTGAFTILDGNKILGHVKVDASGHASYSTSGLGVGPHGITVAYSGDTTYAPTTSFVFQYVEAVPTRMVSAISPDGATFGQTVTITARLTPSIAGLRPLGDAVYISLDGAGFDLAPLDESGRVTYSTSRFPIGRHVIRVSYTGNDLYAASWSEMEYEVLPVPTESWLTIEPKGTVYGQSIVLTAQVIAGSTDVGQLRGRVVFRDGPTLIGEAPLDASGRATYSISTLGVGRHAITASYSGDELYAASTGRVDHEVIPVDTSTAILATPEAGTFGQAITVVAVVTPDKTGLGDLDGLVHFYDGGTLVGSVPVDAGGKATLVIDRPLPGTHAFTASYGGGGVFAPSVSGETPAVATIARAATLTSLSPPAKTVPPGSTIVLAATVATASGEPATGQVSFYANGALIGSADLLDGAASIAVADLAVGSQVITAIYRGDSRHEESTSATASVFVGGPAELFLNRAYLSLLGRPIDPTALDFWKSKVDRVASRAKFIRTIADTAEAKRFAVESSARRFGLSVPPPSLLSAALSLSPFSTTRLKALVLGSDEYYARAGGNPAAFLSSLGVDVLGKSLPRSLAASLSRQLGRGIPRTRVAEQFLRSAPATRAEVIRLHEQIIGRPAPGPNPVIALLGRRDGIDRLKIRLLASDEFFASPDPER